MGLLSQLLNKAIDILPSVAEQALSNAQNSSNTNNSSAAFGSSDNADKLPLRARIEHVCQQSFPEYALDKDVPAYHLGGSPDAYDFTYILYRDNKPKLVILVLYGHNDYKKKSVRLAHDAARTAGAACINIMDYLPSKTAYIQDVIAKNL